MSDLVAMRPGTKFIVELEQGETWHPHPCGGVVIVHPERGADWVREVDGKILRETIVCV